MRRACLAAGLGPAALLFLLKPGGGPAVSWLDWLDPLLVLPAILAFALADASGLPQEFLMFPLLWIETTLLCCALAWLWRRVRN